MGGFGNARAETPNVKMETSNVLSIVIRNLERQRDDVLLIRPGHISAKAMRDLDKTPAGQEMLRKVGVPAFVEGNQQAYLDMLEWLEGR